MKNILITGAKGFIGKNLVATLNEKQEFNIIQIDRSNTKDEFKEAIIKADFIYHLAGINRPKNEEEFFEGNSGLTGEIVDILKENGKNTTIAITSSIQADLDNAYGNSKRLAEEALLNYAKETNAKIIIYRLPNVFGKWCKPNYNSAVATFCNNIASGKEVWVNDRNIELTLVYIDDVVRCLVSNLENEKIVNGYTSVDVEHRATLGHIVDLLNSFRESRKSLQIADMSDMFTKKLYSTYLSYIPEDEFGYELNMHKDERGNFTEFIKSEAFGQVSVNTSKPGITKGNHWHHTKNEKFLVVSGKGLIQFRKIDENEIIEYKVSSDILKVIDIPVGYTHNIINTGDLDMVTIMWCNESYNPEIPDTIFLEV